MVDYIFCGFTESPNEAPPIDVITPATVTLKGTTLLPESAQEAFLHVHGMHLLRVNGKLEKQW